MELNEWLRAYTALWETARRRGVPVKEVIAGIDEGSRKPLRPALRRGESCLATGSRRLRSWCCGSQIWRIWNERSPHQAGGGLLPGLLYVIIYYNI